MLSDLGLCKTSENRPSYVVFTCKKCTLWAFQAVASGNNGTKAVAVCGQCWAPGHLALPHAVCPERSQCPRRCHALLKQVSCPVYFIPLLWGKKTLIPGASQIKRDTTLIDLIQPTLLGCQTFVYRHIVPKRKFSLTFHLLRMQRLAMWKCQALSQSSQIVSSATMCTVQTWQIVTTASTSVL